MFFNYWLSHCLYSKGKAHTKDSNVFDTRINPVMILSCILLTRYGQNLSFSAKTNPLINIQQSFCTFMQLITHLQPQINTRTNISPLKTKVAQIILKNSVCRAKKTQQVSVTKINWLVLCRKPPLLIRRIVRNPLQ
jgi:hypothetical protein